MKNWIYLFLLIFTKILLFIYSKSCFEFSCEDCISEEYGKCTKCKESFILINGTCPCQRSSCALCIDNINNTCFLCKNGNYRWAFTCECNIRNCIECVGNKCLKCYNDYYYNETLNKCVFKKKENNNNNCYDKNCEICEDEDSYYRCYECKKGYYLKNGNCYINETEKCGGIECNIYKNGQYFCNDCVYCSKNNLYDENNCENKELCNIDGCKVCLTEKICFKCSHGYFLQDGQCIQCINGCHTCSKNNECDYCLSGYSLNDEKKCILNDTYLDFNVGLYQNKKQLLIEYFYNIENNNDNYNVLQKLVDINCNLFNDETGHCEKCNFHYTLEDNKCKYVCQDKNCLNCTYISWGNEECTKCKDDYTLFNGECFSNNVSCYEENCELCYDDQKNYCVKCKNGKKPVNGYCTKNNNLDNSYNDFNNECKNIIDNCEICLNDIKCSKCKDNYILNDNKEKCKKKKNNTNIIVSIIYTLLVLMIIGFVLLIYCLMKKQRILHNNDNNININQNNILRIIYSNSDRENKKEKELVKEFEKYLFLGNKYTQKDECNICMKKQFPLGHFKCGCAFQICRECYIQCKLRSNLCPGCRKVV